MYFIKKCQLQKCAPKLVFFNEKKLRKIRMIFDSSPLIQNSKFNNFLWVCWFLGKNLSNFVFPVWKLHNPYFHNAGYEALHSLTGCIQPCDSFQYETEKYLNRDAEMNELVNGTEGKEICKTCNVWPFSWLI